MLARFVEIVENVLILIKVMNIVYSWIATHLVCMY